MADQVCETTKTLEEKIAQRAYELFLLEERAGDHSLEHWLRAEKELAPKPKKQKSSRLDAWCSGACGGQEKCDKQREKANAEPVAVG